MQGMGAAHTNLELTLPVQSQAQKYGIFHHFERSRRNSTFPATALRLEVSSERTYTFRVLLTVLPTLTTLVKLVFR